MLYEFSYLLYFTFTVHHAHYFFPNPLLQQMPTYRTFTDKFQIFANVVERSEIEFVEVRWILNGNYVFTSERLICDKVLPEVWLDVQLLDCLNHVR